MIVNVFFQISYVLVQDTEFRFPYRNNPVVVISMMLLNVVAFTPVCLLKIELMLLVRISRSGMRKTTCHVQRSSFAADERIRTTESFLMLQTRNTSPVDPR